MTNSHSISDNLNNSEEDGLSDIVDAPETGIVIKPKDLKELQSSDEFLAGSSGGDLMGFRTSPKKAIKRNNNERNLQTKKLVVDKSTVSSLQKYYNDKKMKGIKKVGCDNAKILEENPYIPTIHQNGSSTEEFNKQNILIITLYLPIKIKLLEEQTGVFPWEIYVETRDFNSNLLTSLLKGSKSFLWLGILKTANPIPFDKQESLKQKLRDKYHCIAILYDDFELKKIREEFFLLYFDTCLNYTLPRNSSKIFNYDEQLYSIYYKGLQRHFAGEVSILCNFSPSPLIYILDYQLFGLPFFLRTSNESLRIFLYWQVSFLNNDSFFCLPFGQELLNSMLTCNMLCFNSFQEAKTFFLILKEKNGIDYHSSNGLLYIIYNAQIVAIRLAHALIDCELMGDASQIPLGLVDCTWSPEKIYNTYWKDVLEGYEIMISIDDCDRNPCLLFLKLKLIETCLTEISKNASFPKKMRFFEVYTSNFPQNKEFFLKVKQKVKEINEKIGYDGVFFIEIEIPEVLENLLLLNTRFFLETQVYETSLCKIQRFLSLTKNLGTVVIPVSFESWISTQTFNFCCFQHLNPQDFTQKIQLLIQNYSENIENTSNVVKFSPILWLENGFKDFQTNIVQRTNTLFSRNTSLEPLKLPHKKISVPELSKKKTFKKAIFLGFEEVLLSKDALTYIKDDYDQTVKKVFKKPSEGLIETLQKLAKNPHNIVYIVTGLGVEYFGSWAVELESIGVANEYGFLNKDPGSRVFNRLFEMDWNWKDIVKKIMENYCARTPGSVLEVKEACVAWKFQHADHELGNKQAEHLIAHLKEVFENNSEIEVTRNEIYVEARPIGLNKEVLIEILLEKITKEKGCLDLVLCVGGTLSDEEMFFGLNNSLKNKSDIYVIILFYLF